MKILFIPVSQYNFNSNEHIPNRIRLLSELNEVIGVELPGPPFVGIETPRGLIKSLYYGLKVFAFGLRRRKDYDLIYCWEPYFSLVGLCIALFCRKPCVRDNSIVTSQHYLQMMTLKSKITTKIALIAEKTVFKRLDLMIVLSEADKKAYIEMGFKAGKVKYIPIAPEFHFSDDIKIDLIVFRKKLGCGKDTRMLIFTGGRDYLPNWRAASWINDRLAPGISNRYGNVRIVFTGSGPTPKPVHPISVFTGFVPNYFEYIQAADIVIAPLQPKSGVLVKVFDAMSCGKPMVIMTEAAKSMPELVDSYNVMIAGDSNEFIEKTLYLLEHPDLARQIGLRARETMEKYYSSKTWAQMLNEGLEGCLAKPRLHE